jgi:hypothetical protein
VAFISAVPSHGEASGCGAVSCHCTHLGASGARGPILLAGVSVGKGRGLGHSTPAMLRRYTATYDAGKATQVHALFGPAGRWLGLEQALAVRRIFRNCL